MTRNHVIVFLLLFCKPAFGQWAILDSAALEPLAANAIGTFHDATQFQKKIYNGPQHTGYQQSIEGTAYFLTKDWYSGSVSYDGIIYQNETLLYDLVKQILVLKRYDGFAVELQNERVGYFTLGAHYFINVKNETYGIKPGFYERLSSGLLTILGRHEKVLEQKVEEMAVKQKFLGNTNYYAIKDGKRYSIKNLRSVLDLTGSQKSEIQQYLRRGNLKFKDDRDKTLRVIADHYNKTQP